jgi:hypothetical protein
MRPISGALVIVVAVPAAAAAGGTIQINENQSISFGGGIRTSLAIVEKGAPNAEDSSKDLSLNNARIYLSGKLATGISAELNTEIQSGGTAQILDAVVKFEYAEAFRIWAGRFLPPSDRANLDGPFYMPVWDYPFTSTLGFPIFAGRDDGLAVWGQFKGGRFKYQVGAFQGASNPSDNPLLTGRLVLNLRDPEPGYYNSSSYWGSRRILAVAVTAQSQAEGAGAGRDYTSFEADVLLEQPAGSGVVTAEAAYYDSSFGDAADPRQAAAFYVWAGYLFGGKVGVGRFQPLLRYQRSEPDLAGAEAVSRLDLGLNYVIDGDNARVHLVYGRNGDERSEITLGVQLQF